MKSSVTKTGLEPQLNSSRAVGVDSKAAKGKPLDSAVQSKGIPAARRPIKARSAGSAGGVTKVRGKNQSQKRDCGSRVNVREIHFDPKAPELSSSWHRAYKNICRSVQMETASMR